MSVNVATFEVRVKIRGDKPIRYHPWKDGEEYLKVIKTYHIERRTAEQAVKAVNGIGTVLSCRKLDVTQIAGNIESLPLDNAKYVNLSPYKSAVAMEEMIWDKHKKRRKNLLKEKLKEY